MIISLYGDMMKPSSVGGPDNEPTCAESKMTINVTMLVLRVSWCHSSSLKSFPRNVSLQLLFRWSRHDEEEDAIHLDKLLSHSVPVYLLAQSPEMTAKN